MTEDEVIAALKAIGSEAGCSVEELRQCVWEMSAPEELANQASTLSNARTLETLRGLILGDAAWRAWRAGPGQPS